MTAELVERAIAEWNRGEYYEAHETLEDVAESFEDRELDYKIALALVRISASMHKLVNDVGANAVPGKLEGALSDLQGAPDLWNRINLARLKLELTAMNERLAKGEPYEPLPKL